MSRTASWHRTAACLLRPSPQISTLCGQVWNNIGLCFLGKQRFIAAIACLKRAQYLGPFEWIVCYNLGLVHLNTGQYAAAFNYFSAAINLRPSFAHTYMYLGVTLARLGDMENAYQSYQRALEKEKQEPVFYLNFGVTSWTSALHNVLLCMQQSGLTDLALHACMAAADHLCPCSHHIAESGQD